MIQLGVNIDHVATIRQARRTWEPDPVWSAAESHLGGADGITVHLREDRRHIQDHDVRRLKELTHIKLNLEMAATPEMVGIARDVRPHTAMLVPEGREEITTEGGLDVAGGRARLKDAVAEALAEGYDSGDAWPWLFEVLLPDDGGHLRGARESLADAQHAALTKAEENADMPDLVWNVG